MSWKVSDPMSERVKFIGLYETREHTVAGLSQAFGISRKTAYKWIERYGREGLKGLYEQPRTPHSHPQETPPQIREALIEARRKHPTWGPKKLGAWLGRRQPELEIPAPSTIGDILKRDQTETAQTEASHSPDLPGTRGHQAQRGMGRRFQRGVPPGQWDLLLPADHFGRLQSIPRQGTGFGGNGNDGSATGLRTGVPGTGPSRRDPNGQWNSLRFHSLGAAVRALGLVDQARDPADHHSTWKTPGQRPS
jgi:transposase-like protein